MKKEEITKALQSQTTALHRTLEGLNSEHFFKKPLPEKWSIAENIEHLILSVKPLNKLFLAPAITLRTFGKPNRQVRTFEEVKARYYEKLEGVVGTPAGASPFQPKVDIEAVPAVLIKQFEKVHSTFIKRANSYSEKQLDAYLIPHPLLGKLLVREMLYFTAFHIEHHHGIIKNRIE